jgi:hypothetical protein
VSERETAMRRWVAGLERTAGWLLGLADDQQRLICPEHRIEHTGKSACAAILFLELHKQTGKESWAEAAIAQGRRLVARLEREGTSPCHTFRPGRHDPYNCSNSVIDGGACSDALASLVLDLGERLGADEREAFRDASVLHARTYLRYAVLDKGVPAQRAWGLTGLAGAWALSGDQDLADAAAEAFGVLESVQHEDGSYPYHPLEWGAGHPGAADVSCFYQSRVTGFLMFTLERLGRAPGDSLYRKALVRGTDFLRCLVGPDGIKPGLLEAKPWYWGAAYEVASHPFDVYTLASAHHHFGRALDGYAAARSMDAWVRHLTPEGEVRSHLPGPGRARSYQCPLFWAGHACWAARALPRLKELPLDPMPDGHDGSATLELEIVRFPQAQLVWLQDGRVSAWVRGARPPYNVHHGSPGGAGLLRVVRRSDGRDLLPRCRLGGHQAGEWNGWAGAPRPLAGWRAGSHELRFSAWLSRVEWRAGRKASALLTPARIAKRGIAAFAHPRVSSSFARDVELGLESAGAIVRGALAWRGGTPVPGSLFERRFRLDGEGLEVEEHLIERGAARGLRFDAPAQAIGVERSAGRIRYRLA